MHSRLAPNLSSLAALATILFSFAPLTAQPAAVAEALAEPAQVWQIGEREVPLPAAASEALLQSLASGPEPDVEASRRQVPQNDDQVRAIQRMRSATDLKQLSEQLGLEIAKDEIEGVTVYRVEPKKPSSEHAEHLFLHLHGGAYVYNGGDASVGEAALVAASLGMRALSIDYRMPPDHPFPAAVDDVVKVYRKLLEERQAKTILIGGTSAGGGLSLASVHKFKELGLEVPAAIYAGTPWADLSKTGDTLFTLEGLDRILVTYDGSLGHSGKLYAGGEDLKHPLISPVYGDFAGFPPTILITGTRDMFLSDTARTHRKLRAAGVEADLHVFEAVSHADYLVLPRSPEGLETMRELGEFARRHLE